MALSALLFSLLTVLIKRLSPSYSSMELVFHRSLLNVILFAPMVSFDRKGLFPRGKGVMVLRGALGFLSLWCIFFSVEHLPISVATLLMRTSPLFVLALSALFLRERLAGSQLGAAGVAIVGVFFALVQPDTRITGLPHLAAGVGLLGAFLAAASYVSVRAATASFNSWLIVQYYAVISALGSFPFALAAWHLPGREDFGSLVLFGLLASFSQYAMIEGYRVLKAGVAGAMQLLTVPFSLLIGRVFLEERLSALQWAGVVLLSLGVLALTFPPGRKPLLKAPGIA